MAVDALELRPRNAVALFDAALRVCATSAGVWALTLPAGAVVVGAILWLVESVHRGQPFFWPVVALTGTWCVRALAQGAACHFIEGQLIGTTPPSLRASLVAALRRAPSLIIAATLMGAFNLLLWGFTLGLGFLFLGAHAAGYAAAMRGQGSALGLYATCAKLLGPTRHIAPWVRLCGFSQVLLGVNLHALMVSPMVGILPLASGVFGFEVTFAQRFVSFDNPTWVAAICAVSFALFEPMRASTATLLLIDGRVRQEGLDLTAQVEQLPSRNTKRALLSVAIATALFALPAWADSALAQRVKQAARDCDMHVDLSPITKRTVSDRDQSALSRLISRVEHRIYTEEDCAAGEADLREGLRLFSEVQATADNDARARAQEILQRPEFQTIPDKDTVDPKDAPKDDQPGWLARLFKWLLDWLAKDRDQTERKGPVDLQRDSSVSMPGANAVIIGAIVLVVVVLVVILIRSWDRKGPTQHDLDESGGLSQQPLDDPMSALSKPPETWAGLADELAARGEYREAIRHLYLALLARLHRDGVIDYDPTLSNWEYLFGFKGAAQLKDAFKELTRRFDFAWYGNLGVDSLAYGRFRRVAEPLLTPGGGADA